MIITITSTKGGVGKSTVAIHLAAILSADRPTLLIDRDSQRTCYHQYLSHDPPLLPFTVTTATKQHLHVSNFPASSSHWVYDTSSKPTDDDLHDLIQESDTIIVPTFPDHNSLRTLPSIMNRIFDQIENTKKPNKTHTAILLNNVPPPPQRDGENAFAALLDQQYPVFDTYIRSYKCYRTAQHTGGTAFDQRSDERSISARTDFEQLCNELFTINNHKGDL